MRAGLDTMIEGKRKALRGGPDQEANLWLDKIVDIDRQRARAQDLAVEGLLTTDELRAKLEDLEETRKTAKRELEVLRNRRAEVEELERDRDALIKNYAGMVPEGFEGFDPRRGAGPTTSSASTSLPRRTAP
jgi:hypothetical protein